MSRSDDTMRELDDILKSSETSEAYAERFLAFLQLKTKPIPRSNPTLLLGNLDFSFDIDVNEDLIKLPPKPPAPTEKAEPKSPEELQSNAPCISPTKENEHPVRPQSISPTRKFARRSVPTSDRLRRTALYRRSRSLSRRDLLREFNNVLGNDLSFSPTKSSTPTTDKLPTVESVPQATHTEVLSPSKANQAAAVQTDSLQDHYKTSHEPSYASSSQSSRQRTYTIAVGPEPGQLLLSPSKSFSNNSRRESGVHLRPNTEQAKIPSPRAPYTPARGVSPAPPLEREYIVPETPQPDLQQVVHNLTRNSPLAGSPFMVVPISCLSAKSAVTQVETAAPKPTATKVTNRSIQTSNSLRDIKKADLSAILTDDDSDEEQHQELASASQNSTQLLDLHYSRSKDLSSKVNCRSRHHPVLNKADRPAINGEQFAQELARMTNYEILDLRKRQSREPEQPINGRRLRSTDQQLAAEEYKHLEWEILRRNLNQSPARSSRPINRIPTSPSMQSVELDSMSSSSSPLPQSTYTDSSQRGKKLVKRQRNRKFNDLCYTSTQSDENKLFEVCSPPTQFRWSKSRRQSQLMDSPETSLAAPPSLFIDVPESVAEEDKLIEVCSPPTQFRWSKSRRQSQLMGTPETSLAAPPSLFIDEEEPQQQSVHNSYVNRSHNKTPTPPLEHDLIEEIPKKDARVSMRLGTSSRQSRSKKRISKKAQEEQEQKVLREEQLKQQENEKQQQMEQEQEMLRLEEEYSRLEEQQQEEKEQEEMLRMDEEGLRLQEQKKKEQEEALRLAEEEVLQIRQRLEEYQQKKREKKIQKEKEKEANLKHEQEEMLRKEQQRKENQILEEMQQQEHQEQQEQELSLNEQEESDNQQKKNKTKKKKSQKEQEKPQEEHQQQQMEESDQELEQLLPPSPQKDVFVKPTKPAPRAKGKKCKYSSELEKLAIKLRHPAMDWPDIEDVQKQVQEEHSTDGLRRSKRGQVPLRNTWSHTVSEPFAFMCKNLSYCELPAGYKKRFNATRGISMSNRPPLSSSTPRSTPAPGLVCISEEPEESLIAAPAASLKKRERKKKTTQEESESHKKSKTKGSKKK